MVSEVFRGVSKRFKGASRAKSWFCEFPEALRDFADFRVRFSGYQESYRDNAKRIRAFQMNLREFTGFHLSFMGF